MSDETIFAAALEKADPAERAAFLDKACPDPEARARLDRLLAAHDQAGGFMQRPAVAPEGFPTLTQTSDGGGKAEPDEALAFLTPSARPDALGRIGHYDVLQVLGKGAFGIVFRAFDDILQRVVAVKVMAPQLAATSPARKRFLREAQSSAQVRHENVVQVYEVAEQPLPHLAMEFIPGETLQQRLDRVGPVDAAEVVRVGRQIAEGLAAAHACDLIHRDIKPGNVLIEGAQHRVKITDFGLARAADDASISQSGIIAGTPMYMAPEQALGHKLDQRADLFSLGSVLYQMAAGRPPFRANGTVAVLKRVAEDTPRDIREITPETPAWLCDIISKLHAKNPDDRYQTAREVADVLADCEAQLKANSKLRDFSRIPRGKPAPRRSGRGKWVAVALLLLAVALAVPAVGVVAYVLLAQAPRPGPGAPVGGPPQGAPEPAPDGWVPLFNGKDLTGWKPHPDAPGDWRVENGLLTGRGPVQNYLFSERADYRDFHLRTEARINPDGNAGVHFHVAIPRLKPTGAPSGYEVQIAGSRGDVNRTGSVFKFPGKDWLLHQVKDPPAADDAWFTLEVIVRGRRVVTRVNDKTLADVSDAGPEVGHLALQVFENDVVVQFRKIEIKELPPSGLTYQNGVGMEFVVVPKGKAWLGGGKDRLGDKEVDIPADFFLGKYEVTQEEWQKVMGENPSHFSRTGAGADAVKDIPDADLKRFPVDSVSWDLCQEFVAKLNAREKQAGWVYRLPTEIEWEYACRGGPNAGNAESGFDFYVAGSTNTLPAEQANFNSGTIENVKGLNRSCKVGSHPPNSLGLYDMHGNQWEWCNDADTTFDGQPGFVIRGGSWGSPADECTASFRSTRPPANLSTSHGLRLARVPAGAPVPAATAPTLATAPFDAAKAREYQDEWAKHLGVSIEAKSAAGGLRFRLIPPGEFVMGAEPGGTAKKEDRERPQHPVRLTRPFYLGVHEVTIGQFRRFADDEPYKTKAEIDDAGAWGLGGAGESKLVPKSGVNWRTQPDRSSTDDHPVRCLAWEDAVKYCAWLSKKDGKTYRLPTEAEWEFACRAGTTTRYWFGQDFDKSKANLERATMTPQKVGYFPPNPFGLYETHGNVGEWCLDPPREYTFNPVTDPIGTGTQRVYRGGQWFSHEGSGTGRSSDRSIRHAPDRPVIYAGFRVACEVGSADPAPVAQPRPKE